MAVLFTMSTAAVGNTHVQEPPRPEGTDVAAAAAAVAEDRHKAGGCPSAGAFDIAVDTGLGYLQGSVGREPAVVDIAVVAGQYIAVAAAVVAVVVVVVVAVAGGDTAGETGSGAGTAAGSCRLVQEQGRPVAVWQASGLLGHSARRQQASCSPGAKGGMYGHGTQAWR